MPGSEAEEALAALARDLVEEIAAGRALELVQGDQDALELASVRVRSFQRVREGRVEQVRGYQEMRVPGTGLQADELGARGGWIPEDDWLQGQQEWKAKGEAAWKKHEWKSKGGPKGTRQVSGEQSPGAAAEAAQGKEQAAQRAAEAARPAALKPWLPPAAPEPKKGAAAVHPQLHGKTVKMPGDTISGHAHAHVPRPYPVKPPDARDQALAEAGQHLAAHHQADLQRLAAERAAAEAQRTGIPVPGTYAPLDDTQYMMHVLDVENAIASALDAGHATDKTETLDGHGQAWKPERAAAHNEIVQKFLAKAVSVPSEGKGLIMGGLGGAGKSTVLKKIPEIDLTRYAVVNPDDIKEEMAKRGMVPQIEGLSPMESSVLVHEESSHVANLLAQQLLARHKNLAYDITMSSEDGVQKRLGLFRKNGYDDVHGVFVHIPVETSVDRARARHRRGLEAYRQGKGGGGRLVPADLIRSAETKPGSTANQEAFDAVRSQFTGWQTWDNSGTAPKLTGKSAPRQPGGGITSVEDLMKQQQARALDTESAARAPEKGTAAAGGAR